MAPIPSASTDTCKPVVRRNGGGLSRLRGMKRSFPGGLLNDLFAERSLGHVRIGKILTKAVQQCREVSKCCSEENSTIKEIMHIDMKN